MNCKYSLESLTEPNSMFWAKTKKIKILLSKIYHFTAVKNRCILHGYVFARTIDRNLFRMTLVFVMNYNHNNTPMYFNSLCYKILLSSIKERNTLLAIHVWDLGGIALYS